MKTPGFPSEHTKVIHGIALQLGYRFDRIGSGHWVYVHDNQYPFAVAASPSSRYATTSAIAELKRRHPNARIFRKRKSTARSVDNPRPYRRRKSSQKHLTLAQGDTPTGHTRALLTETPKCVGCGRPWLSDLDYGTRACPECGGKVTCQSEAA